MVAYEESPCTILCIMVGIFAALNGEPGSDYSMRRCDLLHNHSCQLAHYGFCPKPLSDVRRALFSLGCLMKESSLSPLLTTPGGNKNLASNPREPQASSITAVNNNSYAILSICLGLFECTYVF